MNTDFYQVRSQIFNYPPSSPPFVPNVQVHPNAQNLLIYICSAVANEAGTKASSGALPRIYAYNVLSEFGWQNQAFTDLVSQVCDYCVYLCNIGSFNSPAAAKDLAVSEMTMGFASALALGNQDLLNNLSPDVINAVMNNNTVYQNTLNRLGSIYQEHYQAPAVSRYPVNQQMNNRGGPRADMRQQHPQQIRHHASQAQQPTQIRHHHHTPVNHTRSTHKPQITKPEPVAVEEPVLLTISKGAEMNRSDHLVAYGGNNYTIPSTPMLRRFEESVERIEETQHDADAPIVGLNDIWKVDNSLDGLIITNTAEHLSTAENFISFGYGAVVTPVFSRSKEKLDDLFTQLASSRSFADVAEKLRLFLDFHNKSKDKASLSEALSIVNQIDAKLTQIVNEFLTNMIESKQTYIQSFTEDVGELTQYLNTKFSSRYNNAYNQFQKTVLEHLFTHTRAAGEPTDVIATYIEFEHENVYWDNLVVVYSTIFVNTTSIELGYDTSESAKAVVKTKTPLLYRLLNCGEIVNSRVATQTFHIVITTDARRFMTFNCVNEKGEKSFKIKEI